MKKILKFLFPIPSLSIMVFTFVIFLLSGGFKTAVEAFIAFFVIVILPLDVVIFAVKYFIQQRRNTEYEEDEEDVEEDGDIEEASAEPLNPIDDFAAQCVADCEFDPEQNNKTPGLDGNFRFDDARFNHPQEDENTRNEIPSDVLEKIASNIFHTYASLGVDVRVPNFIVAKTYVVFYLIPGPGVRKDTICHLEREISLTLGTNVFMNIASKEGFIGLFVPIDYCKNFLI